MDIKIGCDPEIFVKRKADGQLVSAYGLIPGTKDTPFKVKNGAVQVDGMALEFNINPASTKKQFRDNINSVMGQLKAMIGDEYEFHIEPVAHFGKELIDTQPEVARELGCEPDFSAWENGQPNPKPNVDLPFRTASGHIHIGWTEGMDINDPDHIEACHMLTKQLDVMLSIVARLWDMDNTRRDLYGKSGAYRPKPYGLEYRVLSNKWLQHPATINLVYDITVEAVKQLLAGQQHYHGSNLASIEKRTTTLDPTYPWDYYCAYAYGIDTDFFAELYNKRMTEYKASKRNKAEIPAVPPGQWFNFPPAQVAG